MKNHQNDRFGLDEKGRFVIDQYDRKKPFSNFFPGISGLWGIPMWAFYTNRGQCIMSFGIEGKDKSIMEFHPANKAYRRVSTQGFRSFLKVSTGSRTFFYEPFREQTASPAFRCRRSMAMSSHDLTIEEFNETLGLSFRVNYFTLPQEPFAGLIRRVRVSNHSRRHYGIELIDGMPQIVPFGYNDFLLKHLSRTVEAWVHVENMEKKMPFFRLKVAVSDRPQVDEICEGNFFTAFHQTGKKANYLETIVNPLKVFGIKEDLSFPEQFFTPGSFRIPREQNVFNTMPCAFSYSRWKAAPRSEKEVHTLIGHAHSVQELNRIVPNRLSAAYIEEKSAENREIIDGIKDYVWTSSSSRMFDLYCGQTFLDNVLRGGLPVSMETHDKEVFFNVFSRKHGDPERDYNHFVLTPTYFSQGEGNYRDVNQNRRNDVWFHRSVKESAIANFLNLVQADGYNPLVVQGTSFFPEEDADPDAFLKVHLGDKPDPQIKEIIREGFAPGDLLKTIEEKKIRFKTSRKAFLKDLFSSCRKRELARYGEGFWSDHWTYNLDLIEQFLKLYPERLKEVLFENREMTFYHNDHFVRPREGRYILTPRGCRQYHSVADGSGEIRVEKDHMLRIHNGDGPIYHTTLLVKLLCLIANKAATLDPSGLGIEMEADKPNWYDALNGLPGLMGSSISETFELHRLCRFLCGALDEAGVQDDHEFEIFEELFEFIKDLSDILDHRPDELTYWNRANEVKEHYRSRVRQGLDGKQKHVTRRDVTTFLTLVMERTQKAVRLTCKKGGRLPTYFTHEVIRYERLDKISPQGFPYIWPLKFKRHDLPVFLEGFVHAMRVERNPARLKNLYNAVRQSELYDKKLKMYRVNGDLSGESPEIGRARIFPPGWLENQSVWLHMEYKFLLELLKGGLYDEFYNNLPQTLVPFLKPERYARSTLENSSFIVSSVHPNEDQHGQGFVSRLSGSTAEIVHMWLIMNIGPTPFRMNGKRELTLTFQPVLAGWLFTNKGKRQILPNNKAVSLPKNTYAFMLLGTVPVVYHNPRRLNTYGAKAARIGRIDLHYHHHNKTVSVDGAVLEAPYAEDVRQGQVARIDVYFR